MNRMLATQAINNQKSKYRANSLKYWNDRGLNVEDIARDYKFSEDT